MWRNACAFGLVDQRFIIMNAALVIDNEAAYNFISVDIQLECVLNPGWCEHVEINSVLMEESTMSPMG